MSMDGDALCTSTFTTPLRAFAPINMSLVGSSKAYIYITEGSRSGTSGLFVSTLSNMVTVSTGVAIVEALNIAWEITDLPKFPPAYASSVAKLAGVPYTPTPSPGSTSILPQQTSLPPPGLSTGAKAGIGVGAVLGAALLIGIGIVITLLCLRKRQRRSAEATDEHQGANTPEMEDQDATLGRRRWYVGGRWRSEAEVKNDAGELDSRAVHIVPGKG
jgi:hypothetical protein